MASEWGRVMRKLSVALIAAVAFAAAGSALAAEAEAVVRPGPFDAPPAFPARRVYDRPPVYEPAVVPDVLTAPPAFPAVRLYNWTGAYVGINGGGAWGHPSWTSVPDLTSGKCRAVLQRAVVGADRIVGVIFGFPPSDHARGLCRASSTLTGAARVVDGFDVI